ncbi:SWIM zinc finger family protein [Microbispora sp. NPDC049125]|uniref:SWIM zinc finger family protein n=1 Tax=Microbispora sp. NPDC049125 TaxID=3154929 RepID=UPI0034679424
MISAVQAFAYSGPSTLAGGRLTLSTSGGRTARGLPGRPRFFSGLLTEAAPAAAGLLAVADVARARYDRPAPSFSRDPVVTCNGDRLRFESLSACGGVYARLDVLERALDGEVIDLGTTNVDVNGPLREALARVGGADPLHLGVGRDEMAVTTLDGAVVEKKVPLPDRWLRGFAEVQLVTAGFDPRAEVTGPEAARFLRALPRRAGATLWAVPSGRSMRLTASPVPGAVCLPGPDRLATMLPLLRFARTLRLYGPARPDTAVASAWELELPGMRFVLTLSPDSLRSFSTEGAVLRTLASDDAADDADLVRALLAFEPRLDPGLLAERSGLGTSRVRAALTQLGAAGQVGYDTAEAAYFHRELPYDRDKVAAMNPRARAARELTDRGAVRLDGPGRALVVSGDQVREVRGAACTCPWWARHQGRRGPCKHVLAVQIVKGDQA